MSGLSLTLAAYNNHLGSLTKFPNVGLTPTWLTQNLLGQHEVAVKTFQMIPSVHTAEGQQAGRREHSEPGKVVTHLHPDSGKPTRRSQAETVTSMTRTGLGTNPELLDGVTRWAGIPAGCVTSFPIRTGWTPFGVSHE